MVYDTNANEFLISTNGRPLLKV